MIWQFLLVLLGAVLGFAGSFFPQAQFQGKTRPEFEIDTGKGHGDQRYWFLQVYVRNMPMADRRWRTDKWAWSRWVRPTLTCVLGEQAQVAWAAKARIRVSGPNLREPIELWGRWAASPQPIAPTVNPFEGKAAGIELPDRVGLGLPRGIPNVAWLPDESKIPLGEKMDLMPGYVKPLDIAVKFDGHGSCWIFSNLSYFHNNWRKPEWELPAHAFEVRVEVFSGTVKTEKTFRLHNTTQRLNDFHLEGPL